MIKLSVFFPPCREIISWPVAPNPFFSVFHGCFLNCICYSYGTDFVPYKYCWLCQSLQPVITQAGKYSLSEAINIDKYFTQSPLISPAWHLAATATMYDQSIMQINPYFPTFQVILVRLVCTSKRHFILICYKDNDLQYFPLSKVSSKMSVSKMETHLCYFAEVQLLLFALKCISISYNFFFSFLPLM